MGERAARADTERQLISVGINDLARARDRKSKNFSSIHRTCKRLKCNRAEEVITWLVITAIETICHRAYNGAPLARMQVLRC